MGIGFVLIIWAIVGTILAGLGMLVLGGAAALFTRGVTTGRWKPILVAGLFPFACLAWAGGLFVFQAIINDVVFHRDPGLGDTWYCPLPNGYALMMIDLTDNGWVYNPKTQPGSGVGEQEDAIAGVRVVQVAGRFILGGADSQSFQDSGEDSTRVDSYFLMDTETGKRTTFPTQDSLRNAASQLGIQLNLQPIDSVYSKYRLTWFDAFVGLLLFAAPLLALGLLVRWIVRLRRTRRISLQPTRHGADG